KKIESLIPDRFGKGHVKHRDHFNQSPHARPMGQGLKLFAKRKDGSEFPVEISLSNFSIDQNKFVIAFIIDISEKAIFLDQIRQEKELAQMYLDIAPVMFVAISMDERVTLINQEGCKIIGLPESSILGKNWFDIFKPDDTREHERGRFQRLANISADQEFTVDYESVILNSKGERRIIAGKAVLIRDHHGKPITLLASGDDVTERRQQEKRIEQANIELKANSQEILKLNSELEDRVAKRTEELGDLVGKMELANAELATEVRERRQAEELLQKNREELRASLEKEKELGELKSRFVTMASHEFRTPLSTILSSASLISKYNGGDQEEQRTKHLVRIKSSVNNLTTILNDFLSLGKLEEGKVQCNPTEFDMVSFASELTGEMRELTKRGQTINHIAEGVESKVILDKNLTRNICINLLSNAIKYSEEGKLILFKTDISDSKLQISVTDQGIGIPESEQQHIFDRFFRANNAVNIQGTGLGLNIVKKYAELMGGQISFTSQQGIGTTFQVALPQYIE
ncbi:MAG: ATP-binding protein, partial [Bacteroidota bacterium]